MKTKEYKVVITFSDNTTIRTKFLKFVTNRSDCSVFLENLGQILAMCHNFSDSVEYFKSIRRSIPGWSSWVDTYGISVLAELNKIKAVEAEARKAVAAAEGKAQAMRIEADAEAYYSRTVANSITTNLIQWQYVDKWNGVEPTHKLGSNTPVILGR